MPALLFALSLAAASNPPPLLDPYAAAPSAGTPERLIRDAMLGGASEDAAIEAWLKAHPDAPADQRAMLYHRLCNDYGVRIGGEARVTACAAALAIRPDEGDDSDLAIAKAFRAEPGTSAEGSAIVPLTDNPLGSKNADVVVNGVTLPWLIDTGAEITTIPESTASKIGIRFVKGTAKVGSAVGHVTGKLGVVDTLQIGGATVRHLQVLVLPDAMLTITKGYTIPAILGLPAFAALKRMAWIDAGKRLALGDRAPAPSGQTARVYWHEAGLGIPVTTAKGVLGAQFDSGADSTSIRTPGLSLLTPTQRATAVERNAMLGGAGGLIRAKIKVLPRLDYTLAGIPLTARNLTIEQIDDGAGRLGNDLLRQLQTLTIDFTTMTLGAEPVARP